MADDPTEAEIQEGVQAFVNQMVRTTARLVRVTPEGKFEGIASGFILQSRERYFLISAGHAFWSGAQWFLETNCSTPSETLLIRLGPAQLVSAITLTDLEKLLGEESLIGQPGAFELPDLKGTCQESQESKSGKPLDIAWVELDIEALRAQFAKDPRMKGRTLELEVYAGPFDVEPSASEPYGFASMSRVVVEEHELLNLRLLDRKEACELGMEYDGIDPKCDLYRFRLARKHQGHKYYCGSSGSPIADSSRLIVGIVVRGSEEDDIIFGFPLRSPRSGPGAARHG